VGDRDGAIDLLGCAVDRGFTHYRFLAHGDPHLASLRGHPRFERLLERARTASA